METTCLLRPFVLDPTGKNVDEVVAILREAGFTVSTADATYMWNGANGEPRPHSTDPVTVIWIKNDEASQLSVKIFDGSVVEVGPGRDIHAFAKSKDWSAGIDWGVARTLNMMR